MGDNHYTNTRHIDALRWHYRRFRNVPERANMLANVPTMATWDDHDFLANNSNRTCLNRDAALDAFTEYWANPSAGLPATPGVFFNYRYGRWSSSCSIAACTAQILAIRDCDVR